MGCLAPNLFSVAIPICIHDQKLLSSFHRPLWKNPFFGHNSTFRCKKSHLRQLLVLSCINVGENSGSSVKEIENTKFKWVRASPSLTEEQKQAISRLPPKMTNRCKALMKQIICFSAENESLSLKLAAWVKSTSPRRTDWLSVSQELEQLNHPLYCRVEFSCSNSCLQKQEYWVTPHGYSRQFYSILAVILEAVYIDISEFLLLILRWLNMPLPKNHLKLTFVIIPKIIHCYAKENRLQEAENALTAMKNRGFVCDQVTLTALIHMYSKAGNLKLAEDTFEEMKLLGVLLDKIWSYVIMAYIRAGMLTRAERLREKWKLRKSMQRVFDAIQLAGLIPDVKICGLLINAYITSGQSREARIAFENLRRAGLQPNDKCVTLALTAYEKENRLIEALDLLIDLERDGFTIGKESSALLAKWFQKLGVVEEVELVLRDFASRMPQPVL
ncbi:UNVERIFIED_CONTAM: Pentatricopeptide repeat-containing protein [Sesamum calycinum]|uniref:Pentatricopeptide repeat-containing protein n=1 Tax=Sesamum calycinum TaxID=2727403 RepID=A0AAW2QXD7_9LAMI